MLTCVTATGWIKSTAMVLPCENNDQSIKTDNMYEVKSDYCERLILKTNTGRNSISLSRSLSILFF